MKTTFFIASLCAAAVSVHGQPASKLQEMPCPVEIPSPAKADCYSLFVPENRARQDTRLIQIPIVILRTQSAAPKADAVLFTVGGPGGSTLTNMKGRVRIPLLRDRDVILFEQRGSRFAVPALQCPEMNAVRLEESEKNIAGAEAAKLEVAAASTCRSRLVAEGVDLDGYNTSEIAADISVLHSLLKRDFNVYGISYGTQVMLELMRTHPGGIRSVFLDSVLPPSVSYDEFGARNVMRAINAVLTDCEEDVACSRAHPEVRRNFESIVKKLNAQPARAALKSADSKRELSYRINGRNVIEAIVVLLYDTDTIGTIPKLIDATASGDMKPLESALQGNIGESGFTWGARLSVWCHDVAPFNNAAEVRRESRRFPEWAGYRSTTVEPAVCAAWNVSSARPEYAQPVSSAIPTLVYSGEYDPNTPPQWARLVTQTLEHATFVEFAGMAHVAGETRCGWTLLSRFFDDPSKPLDLTCATRFPYAKFR